MQFSMECLVPDNRVHILWQVIPYTLLTIGEILFVVTGMEFSYAEAAPAMKSLVQAIWTMNMAVGNLIFLLLSYLIKKIHLEDTAYEFLISGLLMLIISIVFIFLAQFYYSYVEEDADC
uniref:Solute carrier family 15 member 1 n=3 Tax=Bursaphelenchus xylophilus TaxID=6326 RepID=A0A1I7SIU3_BURXY